MAIAADIAADVGIDTGVDVAAETAADTAADIATDLAADAATDIAEDAVTDAVVDAAEDAAQDIAADTADTAEDSAVETLEESVEETGDPENPEESQQNEKVEADEAKSEEASKTKLTQEQNFNLKLTILTSLILGPGGAALTTYLTKLASSDPDKAKNAVNGATGDAPGIKIDDTGLSSAQWKQINKALGDWDNLSTPDKWSRIYNLQVAQKFNPLQQFQLMQFMETQFALIEKKRGEKQVWSFSEKFDLYSMLLDAKPDAELYSVMENAVSSGQPVLFSVGASLVKQALSTNYYVNNKWTDSRSS